MFSSTPLAILQPRTAIAWQFDSKSVLRAGFGIFSDILPGSVADGVGMNPPYVKTFQGGFSARLVARRSRQAFPIARWTQPSPPISTFTSGFPQGELSCASPQANPSNCLLPVAITAVPSGKLHAPYFMEWSLGVEHQFGTTGSVHVQYVGTRAVNQPYLTQVNGYQTVCDGCFAPFPYAEPTDPRFGAVTQFSTGANSHYNGLQTSAIEASRPRSDGTNQLHLEPLHGHRLERRIPAIFRGRNSFAASRRFGARLRPLRLRHPPQSQRAVHLSIARLKVQNRFLGYALNGWQISGTVFWHSGIPFSVLSTPYSANGDGIVQRQRPAIRERRSGRAALCAQSDFRRHATRHSAVAQSRRVRLRRRSQHRSMRWRRQPRELPVRQLSAATPCAAPISSGAISTSPSGSPLTERVKLRFDAQFFNVFNHPNFGLPSMVLAGIPGKPSTQTGFGALTYTTSPPTGLARRRPRRRQHTPHDRLSIAPRVLAFAFPVPRPSPSMSSRAGRGICSRFCRVAACAPAFAFVVAVRM